MVPPRFLPGGGGNFPPRKDADSLDGRSNRAGKIAGIAPGKEPKEFKFDANSLLSPKHSICNVNSFEFVSGSGNFPINRSVFPASSATFLLPLVLLKQKKKENLKARTEGGFPSFSNCWNRNEFFLRPGLLPGYNLFSAFPIMQHYTEE